MLLILLPFYFGADLLIHILITSRVQMIMDRCVFELIRVSQGYRPKYCKLQYTIILSIQISTFAKPENVIFNIKISILNITTNIRN